MSEINTDLFIDAVQAGTRRSKYAPHAPLTSTDITLIGQSLVSRLSRDARQISEMGPEIVKYCEGRGMSSKDITDVLDLELRRLAKLYELTERFVMQPFPFEMFANKAKEGWPS
jgi:hypothetical protein